MENRTNMEDDRVALLESQLTQAKLIAEEADKKYEEVATQQISLLVKWVTAINAGHPTPNIKIQSCSKEQKATVA